MYFHPLILTEAQKQQRLAACQAFTRLCLDGIDRQHRLHTDVISAFWSRQQESLRALSEAIDFAHLAARHSSRAAPAPLELLTISMRSGEIAADIQRDVATLVDRHARELSRSAFDRSALAGTAPRRDSSAEKKSRRRQMMA